MMASAELNHELILQTFYEVLGRDNALSRCRAINALARVDGRDDESRRRLIDMLMDPDPDVRTDAAVTLGRMRVSEANQALLGSLENDPDGEVRVEALRALAEIGSPASVEPLIRCLEAEGYPELEEGYIDDEMPYAACFEIHSQTLDALGKLGDARATESVIALLENDEYADLQERGFRALAEISSDKARQFLLTRLTSDDPLSRRRAARALTALPGLDADSEALSAEIVNRLTNALMDPDPGVRIHAARALAGSDNPLVMVPLTMLLADPETEVRREVAAMLGGVQGSLIVDRLHGLLEDPDPQVRRDVAKVLGKIGDPASFAVLSPLLEVEDEDLLHDVIEALGKIGVGGAEAKLAEILTNDEAHFSVRLEAAKALGRLLRAGGSAQPSEEARAPSRPMAALEHALGDSHDAVCQAALQALVHIDGENAVATLSELVRGAHPMREAPSESDAEAESNVAAAEAESDVAAAEAEIPEDVQRLIFDRDPSTSTLAAMLNAPVEEKQATAEEAQGEQSAGPRASVRALAAQLLGGLAKPGGRATRCLMEAYADGDKALRREIVVALGRIGDGEALPLIAEALAADEEEVRLAALDALEGFPGASAADEQLVALLDDESAYVRERAVHAIGATKGAATLAHLPRMLGDSDRAVCRAALRALPGDMKSEELSAHIVDLMFQFSAELTGDAAAALRRMNDSDSAARLLSMLNDPKQEEFHWICIDALAEMFAREPGATA